MCKVRIGLNSTDLNNTHYVTMHTTFTKSWLFICRGMLQQKMKEILQKEDDLQEIVQSLVSAKDRSWMLPPFFVALLFALRTTNKLFVSKQVLTVLICSDTLCRARVA